MRHYRALQRQDNNRWDFTISTRDGAAPIGYCRSSDYGHHDTQEDAEECYKRYTLDNRVRYKKPKEGAEGEYSKCKKCGKLTNGYVNIGRIQIIQLCEEHQTREVLDELYEAPEEMWAS